MAKDLANEIMAPDDEEVLEADLPEMGRAAKSMHVPRKDGRHNLYTINPEHLLPHVSNFLFPSTMH